MADVFISYKRQDRAKVERVAQCLRDLGYSVWFDASLTAGEAFDDEIEREVHAARAVLVLWSNQSVKSRWVKNEAGVGLDRGVLVAARVEDCKPPFAFRDIHHDDIFPIRSIPAEPGWRRIVDRIATLTRKAPRAPSSPEPKRSPPTPASASSPALKLRAKGFTRRQQIGLGVGAGIAAASGAGWYFFRGQNSGSPRASQESLTAEPLSGQMLSDQTSEISTPTTPVTQDPAPPRTVGALRVFTGQPQSVLALASSPDDAYLLSGSGPSNETDNIRLWNKGTGEFVKAFQWGNGYSYWVYDVAFSPTGDSVAAASSANEVKIWDFATARVTQTLSGHTDFVNSSVYSRDGARMGTTSRDNTARLWDIATGATIHEFRGHGNDTTDFAFAPNSQFVATGSFDNTVRLWDGQSGQLVGVLRHPGDVRTLCFSSDGAVLFTGCGDGVVRQWNVATKQQVAEYQGFTGEIWSIVLSRDNSRLLVAGDGMPQVLDARSGARLLGLRGHAGIVSCIRFVDNDRAAITAGFDRRIRLWSLA